MTNIELPGWLLSWLRDQNPTKEISGDLVIWRLGDKSNGCTRVVGWNNTYKLESRDGVIKPLNCADDLPHGEKAHYEYEGNVALKVAGEAETESSADAPR